MELEESTLEKAIAYIENKVFLPPKCSIGMPRVCLGELTLFSV